MEMYINKDRHLRDINKKPHRQKWGLILNREGIPLSSFWTIVDYLIQTNVSSLLARGVGDFYILKSTFRPYHSS